MKTVIMTAALTIAAVTLSAPASAKSSCEEVTAQIEAKIKAMGVKDFTLTIVPKDENSELKVVGNCDGGSKKILYKRG